MADAIAHLHAVLPALDGPGAPMGSLVPPIPGAAPERDRRCRIAVSAIFLATLEFARDGSAAMTQTQAWHAIRVGKPAPP